MKHFLSALILIFFSFCANGQSTLKIVVKDVVSNETIPGAEVKIKNSTIGKSTDENGAVVMDNVPDGLQVVVVNATGYQQLEMQVEVPYSKDLILELTPQEDELDEIIVEGTRSNRSIDNIPTRVEVLTEEIDEASTMDPSKVAHLLTHSTGIQVQQTSATSNTANVRIQGLDGRYTQMLKDGFPLYGGFSGSLSIMQIPPLDLRQIEYVKGSASTLYGAGAIAGLINLLSKEPKEGKDEALIHINASHIGAFDVNAFTSARRGKLGYTLLAQRNTHQYFDADKDGFTDLPQLIKYNLNPKLFLYFNPKTKMYVGATITNEVRQGGDTRLFDYEKPDSLHFYKEKNDINRITTQVKFDHELGEKAVFTVRNSFNIFHRELSSVSSPWQDEYRFAGDQLSSFSEISYSVKKKQNTFITGLNFYSDDFKEEKFLSDDLRNESLLTIGYFANYTFDLGKKVAIESGLRADYVINDTLHLLPRLSALFKWTSKLTTRIGGGMGYRNATIFNQEAELRGYLNVVPIDRNIVVAENSYGGNADVGFKTGLGNWGFLNISQMFFYTNLEKPLVLARIPGTSGNYRYQNANGYSQSYGTETFFKLGFYDFVWFVGYTYTHATNHFGDSTVYITLTPQHSIKGDLLYALPGKWRIGADYEYKSGQRLNNGTISPAFWTFGVVVEYTNKQFTLFCNVENYTNVRQTKYGSLVSGPHNTPQFTDVWAPLDGIVVNAGVKVRL